LERTEAGGAGLVLDLAGIVGVTAVLMRRGYGLTGPKTDARAVFSGLCIFMLDLVAGYCMYRGTPQPPQETCSDAPQDH
jgi:hypothetical protein